MNKTAVGYARVSTDDKKQDPARQSREIKEWAKGHGVELLAVETDDGVSATKTDPFERPGFRRAVATAIASHAAAVVVAEPDRFCRQGSDHYGHAKVELKQQGLGLWVVTYGAPADQDAERVDVAVRQAVDAASARKWAIDHGQRVASGMRHKKALGQHIGRPPKPALSALERQGVAELRSAGIGWDRCALTVSGWRGAFTTTDAKKRRDRTVSARWLKRQLQEADQ